MRLLLPEYATMELVSTLRRLPPLDPIWSYALAMLSTIDYTGA